MPDNIPEIPADYANWVPQVPAILTSDRLLGDTLEAAEVTGPLNAGRKALTLRTLFLKTAVEALQVSLGGLNFATQADIDAAISAVVNTSPATLDTLNELAAALGDDPNFATTMTALIGTKLNANTFTGAAILALLLSVDGVGSGLDADKLDGNEATAFATAAQGAKADAALPAANVLDEDTFATNSPTKPASQQSTKVYIAAELATAIANLVAASPGTLDTLNELAAALGDDPNFAATMTALIGTKLNASTYTAADILAKLVALGLLTNLNADMLDGKHASEFVLQTNLHNTLIVRDEKANNVNGQTITAGIWNVRHLNSTVENTLSGSSLSGNQVTLPAGKRSWCIDVPAFGINNYKTQLWDVTNGVGLDIGIQGNAHSSLYATTISKIIGSETFAGPTVVEIRHTSVTTNAAGGGDGRKGGAADTLPNIFTIAQFW